MLYQLHHRFNQSMVPVNFWAQAFRKYLSVTSALPYNLDFFIRPTIAQLELIERCTNNYDKPEFNLPYTEIDGEKIKVTEEVVQSLPFCNLLHFKREGKHNHPKVLIISPLSGHYATLLRGTVEHFIPDHEVYITDWINARDVPLNQGGLNFNDFVRYLIGFIEKIGPDTHVVGVCQPTVAAIIATTVMTERNNPNIPKSLTLMGGPIDTRLNPTEVNEFSAGKNLEWFEKNVINTVPYGFPGAGQKVYPGFIQLTGFMSMNMDNHIQKHYQFFKDLIKNDGDSAEAHRKFYNEYLAVMDLPADFYLDTIRKVFLDHRLPQGKIHFEKENIDPKVVTKTALLTIEGEKDDITGKGQTKAAHEVLSGIPKSKKHHYEQPGVGHYGIFNGRRFREIIGPKIKAFIKENDT